MKIDARSTHLHSLSIRNTPIQLIFLSLLRAVSGLVLPSLWLARTAATGPPTVAASSFYFSSLRSAISYSFTALTQTLAPRSATAAAVISRAVAARRDLPSSQHEQSRRVQPRHFRRLTFSLSFSLNPPPTSSPNSPSLSSPSLYVPSLLNKIQHCLSRTPVIIVVKLWRRPRLFPPDRTPLSPSSSMTVRRCVCPTDRLSLPVRRRLPLPEPPSRD